MAPIIIVMVNISTLALHSNQPIMADLSVLGTGIIETELLVACTFFSSIIIFFGSSSVFNHCDLYKKHTSNVLYRSHFKLIQKPYYKYFRIILEIDCVRFKSGQSRNKNCPWPLFSILRDWSSLFWWKLTKRKHT